MMHRHSFRDEIECVTPSFGLPVRELPKVEQPLDDVELEPVKPADLSKSEREVFAVLMGKRWLTTEVVSRAVGKTPPWVREVLGLLVKCHLAEQRLAQRAGKGAASWEWRRVERIVRQSSDGGRGG